MDRFDELVSEYLDGSLSPSEAEELGCLLEADPARRDVFVDLVRQGRALSAELKPPPGDAFARGVMQELGRNPGAFVQGVMRDVRRSAARRWWVPAAAAGLVFAAVLGLVLLPRAGEPAPVVRTGGRLEVHRDGRRLEGVAGLRLRPGDEVRTEEGSRSVLAYEGEETRLEIEPFSVVRLESGPAGKRIVLRQGEIRATVAPQPSGRPLVIEGPHARAEVLGTRLTLSAAEDATRLEVEEGRVRLVREPDGSAVEVPARHFSVAGADPGLRAEPVPPPSDRPPRVAGFSLIQLDAPRAPIPGFEDLRDGAVINLAKLPTRRVNIQAHTDPPRVGSLRFLYRGKENFNTELIWPYTLAPHDGVKGRLWDVAPGVHTLTATPFAGSYANGLRGEPRTLTVTVIDEP
jgi:ferric-dicitrate binding protein FerR (iron transport regulator)